MVAKELENSVEAVLDACTRVFLVPFEGTGPMTPDKKAFVAYRDMVGVLTVAWGLTYHPDGTKIQEGEVWDYDYAVKAKSKVLIQFYTGMIKLAPNLVNEPLNRQASILSWVYNLGLGAFRASTFRKRILESDWESASEECLRWDKAGGKTVRGLTRRRQFEAKFITKP